MSEQVENLPVRRVPPKGLEHLAEADGLMTVGSPAHEAWKADFAARLSNDPRRRRRRRRRGRATGSLAPSVGRSGPAGTPPAVDFRTDVWKRAQGPVLWAMLHKWGMEADLSTPEKVAEAKNWLALFTGKIPCGECKGHWLQLLRALPPDFADNERLYAWTVEAHNAVNRRLGKPVWGLVKCNP